MAEGSRPKGEAEAGIQEAACNVLARHHHRVTGGTPGPAARITPGAIDGRPVGIGERNVTRLLAR